MCAEEGCVGCWKIVQKERDVSLSQPGHGGTRREKDENGEENAAYE